MKTFPILISILQVKSDSSYNLDSICLKLKGLNPNPKMMREALSKRLSEDEIDRAIIIGKDISKRGIPIYRNLI